jgi:GH3 auxin-responsive promoter
VRVAAANLAWAAHAALGARRWRRLTRRVEEAQEQVLARIVRPNWDTEFGREHGFRRAGSVAEFRRRVPIRGYDELAPWIDRVADGRPRVLTAEPVLRFGVTSGTARASKLVPYTASLLREFQAGIAPWAYHLFRRRPGLLRGTCYWSLTPVAARETHTRGGIPVGFEDERCYLGRAGRRIVDTVMPIPPDVARIEDVDRFRYVTLHLLLEQESLAWISVWNPTFLTLLVEPLVAWQEPLLDDLAAGTISPATGLPPAVLSRVRARPERARRLRAVFSRRAGMAATARDERGRTLYEEVWPRLALVSAWADAAAADVLPVLREVFPSAAVQRKGLVATEAFVSFPLTDELAALSLGSHFFEFLEAESPERVRLAHELERGRAYSVVVTTGGGLYRYRLGDLVEVVGFENACPLVRFVGREEGVVDLRGEKLADRFVRDCAEAVFAEEGVDPAFWLLAPRGEGASAVSYALFVELRAGDGGSDALAHVADALEARLRRNYHYDYCRRLGQLGPCRVFRIEPGTNARNVYLTGRAELGQRLGDVKPAAVDASDRWAERFPGSFL